MRSAWRLIGAVIAAAVLTAGGAHAGPRHTHSHATGAIARPDAAEVTQHEGVFVRAVVLPVGSALDLGGVWVDLLIDRRGYAIATRARSGPAAVFKAAEAAASGVIFQPFVRAGRAVPARASLFIPIEVQDDRPTAVAVAAGPPDSVRITLSRTPCMGGCSTYSVEIEGDGTVRYQGLDDVVVVGEHLTLAPRDRVHDLVDRFRAADFWGQDLEFDTNVADAPITTVSITIGGRTRRLIHQGRFVGGGLAWVEPLEDAIEQVAGTKRWTNGDAEIIPALEAEHLDFHSTAAAQLLERAVERAPDQVVIDLMARGAPLLEHPSGAKSWSALTAACGYDRLAVVRALIAAGALDGSKIRTRAALEAAVERGYPDVAAEILKTQPALDLRGAYGASLLGSAAGTMASSDAKGNRMDYAAVIRQLARAGADPNRADSHGNTALAYATFADNTQALIESGARVNVRDRAGDTPLTAARDEDVALVLIGAGANVMARGHDGKTIYDHAKAENWDRVLAVLNKDAGAKP
jgi:ankyrin repeat protein